MGRAGAANLDVIQEVETLGVVFYLALESWGVPQRIWELIAKIYRNDSQIKKSHQKYSMVCYIQKLFFSTSVGTKHQCQDRFKTSGIGTSSVTDQLSLLDYWP